MSPWFPVQASLEEGAGCITGKRSECLLHLLRCGSQTWGTLELLQETEHPHAHQTLSVTQYMLPHRQTISQTCLSAVANNTMQIYISTHWIYSCWLLYILHWQTLKVKITIVWVSAMLLTLKRVLQHNKLGKQWPRKGWNSCHQTHIYNCVQIVTGLHYSLSTLL